MVSASSTLCPRTLSITRRTLRGEMGISFATARTSIVPLPHVGGSAARVPLEGARGGKLTQLVAHHVLAHVDRHMAAPVVYGDRMADELGKDRRIARPGADDLPLVAAIQGLDLAE